MAIAKNESWVNFINLYKNLPELWNVKCDKYKKKNIRAAAYEKLTNGYKNIDETATVEKVKNRIRNMRFTYKRELRKKISSEKSGAFVDDPYEPKLWYFNEFNFLKEFELAEDGISSDDEVVPQECEPISKKKKKNSSSTDELVRLATQRLKVLPNFYQQTAIVWGEKLSKMNRNQRIIAEKVINEVMFSGELNLLTFNTTLAHINSVCNLDPSSSAAFDKNVAMSGSESLVESPNTDPYAVRFNQIANDAIHDHINYPSSSGESVNDEVITDRANEQNEQNFVISEYDPLDNTIKVEE